MAIATVTVTARRFLGSLSVLEPDAIYAVTVSGKNRTGILYRDRLPWHVTGV